VGRVVRHWGLRLNDKMVVVVVGVVEVVEVVNVVVGTVQPADKEHSKHHAQDSVGHHWG